MAKELEKTLKVNDEEYNINAVTADKVANALAAKKINLTKDDEPNTANVESDFFDFDGSSSKSPVLVPASGGRFKGRITVPDVSEGVLKKDGQTVINYNDIVTRVVDKLLNTSAMATWDSTSGELSFTNDTTGAVSGLCVVKGLESEFIDFVLWNVENKRLADYLYISTDIGNIYLGTSDNTSVTRLGANAVKLSQPRNFITNLNSEEAGAFDGTADVESGVKDILPIRHGGSGAADAAGACENIIKNQSICPGSITINTPNNTNTDAYKHKIFGKFGIDLQNSDIVGLNALYFADVSDTYSEGINFIHTLNKDDDSLTTYDRLYSRDGQLYYDPNKKLKDDYISNTRYVVYHSGSNLDGVTVGQASKLNTTYEYQKGTNKPKITETKASKITISYEGPSGGADGDIWIKY